MPGDAVHHPHDKLFKTGFGDPLTAAAFLREELPAEIASQIDWTKLHRESGSFVDSHYQQFESDLLFSAPLTGSPCLIYLLFEHQTTPDPLLGLRLLRYMVRIWEVFVKEHPGADPPLPVILPVVLAQNAVAWKTNPQFSSLLNLPAHLEPTLRPYLPDFLFRLIQLAEMPFESIRGTPSGILILRTMKAERLERLLDGVVWDEALLAQVPREIFELILRYILAADIDKSAFETKIQHIHDSQVRSKAMTLAQQYHAEGRQEGALQSRRQDVLDLLEFRFGEIPPGLQEEIDSIMDENKLRVLLRAVVQCPSIEAFADAL